MYTHKCVTCYKVNVHACTHALYKQASKRRMTCNGYYSSFSAKSSRHFESRSSLHVSYLAALTILITLFLSHKYETIISHMFNLFLIYTVDLVDYPDLNFLERSFHFGPCSNKLF